jgi:hypothetical protein
MDITLILTRHADDRRKIEGITIEQIKECIRKGSKYRQTDGLKCVYGYVNVAYKIVNGKCIIKTVFVTKYDGD